MHHSQTKQAPKLVRLVQHNQYHKHMVCNVNLSIFNWNAVKQKSTRIYPSIGSFKQKISQCKGDIVPFKRRIEQEKTENWLFDHGSSPVITSFYEAGYDVVDLHINAIFRSFNSLDNYLRIQDDTLTGTATGVDVGNKENLEHLAVIAEDLLKKPVSRVDLESGRFIPLKNGGTYGEALKRFAKMLSEERKLRELNFNAANTTKTANPTTFSELKTAVTA